MVPGAVQSRVGGLSHVWNTILVINYIHVGDGCPDTCGADRHVDQEEVHKSILSTLFHKVFSDWAELWELGGIKMYMH